MAVWEESSSSILYLTNDMHFTNTKEAEGRLEEKAGEKDSLALKRNKMVAEQEAQMAEAENERNRFQDKLTKIESLQKQIAAM